MSRSLNDISVESMLTDLFSTESEGATKLEEGVYDQLSEDERDIVDGPVDEEEGADPEDLTAKGEECLGEINSMQLALRTAEEYLWTNATEENVFKKFWEWLKKMFEKIALFMVTQWKRFQVWIAGDMKKISSWAKENTQKLSSLSDKAKKEAKVKALVPSEPSKIIAIADRMKGAVNSAANSAVSHLNSGKVDEGTKKTLDTFVSEVGGVKKIRELMYGKDAKAKEVSFNDIDTAIPKIRLIPALSKGRILSDQNTGKVFQDTIKNSKNMVKTAEKYARAQTSEKTDIKAIKAYASSCQRALSVVSSVQYFLAADDIRLVKVAFAVAKKAVAIDAKEEKKD